MVGSGLLRFVLVPALTIFDAKTLWHGVCHGAATEGKIGTGNGVLAASLVCYSAICSLVDGLHPIHRGHFALTGEWDFGLQLEHLRELKKMGRHPAQSSHENGSWGDRKSGQWENRPTEKKPRTGLMARAAT